MLKKDEDSQYPVLDDDTPKDEMEIGNEDLFSARDKIVKTRVSWDRVKGDHTSMNHRSRKHKTSPSKNRADLHFAPSTALERIRWRSG